MLSVLFDGIDVAARNRILAEARKKKVPASQIVIRGGERASRLFLLAVGSIKFYRVTPQGSEVLLWLLSEGDVFGLGTLLSRPAFYLGTAETLRKCELYEWEHDGARKMGAAYPRLAENVLRIILRYASDHADRLVDIVAETAPQRVAHALLGLAHRAGKIANDGLKVDITNEHLSAIANVSPFTVSRVLSKWERSGALTKTRGNVRIHVPERLALE